jgi:hypothetical protein
MIKATLDFVKFEKNIVEKTLKNVIIDLEK